MRALVLLLGLIAAGCVGTPVQHEYSGADAGALVYSSQAIGGTLDFELFVRPVGHTMQPAVSQPDAKIMHFGPRFHLRSRDFTGHERGWVTVRYMKPGDYEIYQYNIIGGPESYFTDVDGIAFAMSDTSIRAPQDFSLRFRIEPEKATYIGSFSSGPADNSGAILTILDRHERDLAIARKADPNLPVAFIVTVPTVGKGEIPLLQGERLIP